MLTWSQFWAILISQIPAEVAELADAIALWARGRNLPKKTDFNLLSIALFGSLAKGTDVKKSDIDLFILVPSKKKYDEAVEMECVALSKGFAVEINPIVSEPANLLTMLKEKEQNVGEA